MKIRANEGKWCDVDSYEHELKSPFIYLKISNLQPDETYDVNIVVTKKTVKVKKLLELNLDAVGKKAFHPFNSADSFFNF